MELEHAGKVFPGTRREVHIYLSSVGYDYVATLAVDDLFVRRDLNTPEELGLDREGRRAVGTTRDFYHLYDARSVSSLAPKYTLLAHFISPFPAWRASPARRSGIEGTLAPPNQLRRRRKGLNCSRFSHLVKL